MNKLRIAKKGQLTNYAVMIASRFFETIEDFINLEISAKRLGRNLEKFHYNPISLNEKTIDFFPNIQTLYLYEEKDVKIERENIKKYKYMYVKSYGEYIKRNENEIYMKVEHRGDDPPLELNPIPECIFKISNLYFDDERPFIDHLIIHSNITKIEETSTLNIEKESNKRMMRIKEITIENPKFQFGRFPAESFFLIETFEKINIPKEWKVEYPFIIDNNENLNMYMIYKHIKHINNIEIEKYEKNIKRYEIPKHVTSLNYLCYAFPFTYFDFKNFYELEEKKVIENDEMIEEIKIPPSIVSIGHNCFHYVWIKSIEIPDSVTSIGNFSFFRLPFLTSIKLSKNLKEIGEGSFQLLRDIETITIPSSVTSIGPRCFHLCSKLKKIKIENKTNSNETIKVGYSTFSYNPELEEFEYLKGKIEYNGDGIFSDCPKVKIKMNWN